MKQIIGMARPFLIKDLIIAVLIVGLLILTGAPFMDSRGINTVLFFIVVLTLWKFKRTNSFLLSATRVLQMVNLVGAIVGLAFYGLVAKQLTYQSLKLPLVMVLGFILQGFMYYYLSIWSKLLKNGKEIDLSLYKKPLIIISIALGVFILFGEDILKWYFAS